MVADGKRPDSTRDRRLATLNLRTPGILLPKRLSLAVTNAASPPEQLMSLDAICAISQNGTAVAFINQNNEIKIIPLDAQQDEMQVESGSTIGTTGDTFAIAADASKVIYVTSDPIDEDDDNNAADLAMPTSTRNISNSASRHGSK